LTTKSKKGKMAYLMRRDPPQRTIYRRRKTQKRSSTDTPEKSSCWAGVGERRWEGGRGGGWGGKRWGHYGGEGGIGSFSTDHNFT